MRILHQNRPKNLNQANTAWSPHRRFFVLASVAIAATVVSAVLLDRHVGVLAIESKMPGDIRAFFQCLSFFGHGTGCLVAVSLIWTLDRSNRAAIPLIIGSVLLAGLISSVIKVIVHRPRPFVDPATLGDGITLNEAVFHNFLQSFPSGHTATAFALTMALSLLYRQGKTLFFLFALLVGLQRIISQNHFPSDVIAGALVGITSAHAVHLLLRQRFSLPHDPQQLLSEPEKIDSNAANNVNGISPA